MQIRVMRIYATQQHTNLHNKKRSIHVFPPSLLKQQQSNTPASCIFNKREKGKKERKTNQAAQGIWMAKFSPTYG